MIVREAWPFIAMGSLLTVALAFAAARFNSMLLFVIGLVMAVLTLFTFFFFRDPERVCPDQPDILLAPADGKVVAVTPIGFHPYIGSDAVRVSIFLSIFDVHVNRVPASGVIDFVNYNRGKFLAAFVHKASQENEQTEIGMTTEGGQKLIFKQIAGLVARRIVCRLKPGDRRVAGDEFGMIRFGSRADLIIPADSRIEVEVGDRVAGGESVIGYLNPVPMSGQEPSPEGNHAEL